MTITPQHILKNSNSIIAISNYKTSKEIEEFTEKYDCIIRFNNGSDSIIMREKNQFFNNRVDLAVLSGFLFHKLNLGAYKNIPILFSRPIENPNENQTIFANDSFLLKQKVIDQVSDKIFSAIPYNVYLEFFNTYNYDHPSTGLLTLYYIKKFINSNISGINFFIDDEMFNSIIDRKSNGHKIGIERDIFKSLDIENIQIL